VVGADLVLDGVSGLGGRPGLASAVTDLLTAVPSSALVVAVDLPSGLDPASGRADAPHVRADRTVTFGALKPALLLPPAAHAAGVVHVVDIGLGPYLPPEPLVRRLTGADVGARWPTPRAVDHKYTRGVLGVIAGSVTYPGAAVLACTGAVRAGAGIVKYTGPAAVAARVIAARPEVVARPGSVNAYLLGSGVFADPAQDAAVLAALGSGLPCVVDAGALEQCVLARRDGAPTGPTARSRAPGDRMLLTPHAGELARLLPLVGPGATREDVEADPAGHARRLARAVDVTVLVKGPITLVVPPDGPIYSQAEGTPWLASAGTGDVLAGIAGALLASGLGAAPAGALAATVHGRAGVRAGGPLTALGVADAVPEVLADLLVDPFGG
jgi:ADP-dependent NAD(P)H-hydrate dehydratase / NAD(P)H-hydrate epimerase